MSVIMSRAIPEIDGFKPSHRKLLYTMYKMGLLGSARTKSANIVGQTMKLNPHGDSAIYDTMVRLSRGYEALLHPYIDSKGNFGKYYSRDMAWAASRYTEARLDDICQAVSYTHLDVYKRQMFASNIDTYKEKYSLISTAEVYHGCAIACTDESTPNVRVASAQAADELLSIQGVNASFVLFKRCV